MLKNYRKFFAASVLAFGLVACGDDVTITEAPPAPTPEPTPNIVSFSVAPSTATIAVGQTVQASYSLQTKAGVAGTVAFASGNAAVATVDAATGLITAVSNGTALIEATATAGGQTAKAQIGITVRNLAPAQISIQSVTQFANTVPVPLNNVNGQIEVNMNFNPGEQTVDSVAVFIGSKRAAKQSYVTNPAAGIISLSINTANFVKNSTTGVATVDYQNGASTISAAVYPRGGAATATNTIAIVLNNADAWAADMSAPSAFANNAGGLTYWGGPTTGGLTTATVYPVIYTPGRSVQTITFRVGGCNNFVDTSLPFRAVVGSNAAATSVCTYEYTGGARDNVAIVSAIDNTNNPFVSTALLANVVVPGSTPDSLRFDWGSPTANTLPSVAGAYTFNWVNAAWTFAGASASDVGVGMPASPVYNKYVTGTTTPVIASGADLNETNTNNATDGYRLYFTTTDRLGNARTSGNTAYFGVDKTIPSIRYPSAANLPLRQTYAAGDTVTAVTAGTGVWAVEAIDNRSGLFDNVTDGKTGGVDQAVTRLAPGFLGTSVSVAADDNYAATMVDGWRQTVAIPVFGSSGGTNATSGYYTYTATIRDRAGNATTLANAPSVTGSAAAAQRRYAIDNAAPTATGLTMPFTFGSSALSLAGTFQFAAQDDLEVISAQLGISLPDAVTGGANRPIVFPSLAVGTKWDGTLAGAIATAQNLTTPVLATLSTPDFWANVQIMCSVAQGPCAPVDADGGLGGPLAGLYAPDSVSAVAVDVFGTKSAPTASAILAGSLPTTTALPANTYSGNYLATGIQVRYEPAVSATTVRQVSTFSVTLPQLNRLHLFKLVGTEWVYQATVLGSAGVGSDNGFERFWDYSFSGLSAAGTYAVLSVYDGPITTAKGTALWYRFTK